MPRLLIIGGTGEARHLANAVSTIHGQNLSLVTSRLGLVPPSGPVAGDMRQGGFGGVAGLMAYFKKEKIDWVIDASHPFAAAISRNTRAACLETGRAYLRIERPAWWRVGRKWHICPGFEEICAALPAGARRCFLTVGAGGAAAFAAAYRQQTYRRQKEQKFLPPRYWLVRAAARPDDQERAAWQAAFGPPLSPVSLRMPGRNRRGGFSLWLQRGPFTVSREIALLNRFRIDCLIAKMSGGSATRAKLSAADHLGIPCLLLKRPSAVASPLGGGDDHVAGVAAALDWLAHKVLSSRRHPCIDG